MLEFKYDTQLLIEKEKIWMRMRSANISLGISRGDCLLAVGDDVS